MFASSNLLDIKDLEEDKQEKIMTIPVVFGEKPAICLSHLGLLFAIILFSQNQNYYENIWLSSIYQLQNFGSFFLMYNMTITN
jgi:4-hydroxybenzoate polyprenyltransferase